jgi:hypothetical protein
MLHCEECVYPSDFDKCSSRSIDGGRVNKVDFLFELFITESWNVANPFENIVDHYYKL